MKRVRPNIRRMHGYEYGAQPQGCDIVKLNTNENPYPPTPKVAAVLRDFIASRLRLYPDASATGLRELIAERHRVKASQVVVTNGGDEGISLIFTTCLDAGDVVATTDPSYTLYEVLAAVQDCEVHRTPLTNDFDMPDRCTLSWQNANVKLGCLVNPHSPSGRLYDRDCIADLAGAISGILLVDEAYVDFVDPSLDHDILPLLREYENIVILRTFSKGHSLAGLRLGYLLGNEDFIQAIATKTRDSNNVDVVSQEIGSAVFCDIEYLDRTIATVRDAREKLRTELTQMGFDVPPTQTNFLLIRDIQERNLSSIQRQLIKSNIYVRRFDTPRLRSSLRITVGTESQNNALTNALSEIIR